MKAMRLGDLASAALAEAEMQGEIESQMKDLIHRDSMFARKRPSHSLDGNLTEPNQLIERISAASMEAIDQAISQLQRMKSSLLDQNEKVRRELQALELANEEAAGQLKEVSTILDQWRQKSSDTTSQAAE